MAESTIKRDYNTSPVKSYHIDMTTKKTLTITAPGQGYVVFLIFGAGYNPFAYLVFGGGLTTSDRYVRIQKIADESSNVASITVIDGGIRIVFSQEWVQTNVLCSVNCVLTAST